MNDFAERYGPWALIAGASEGTGASFARQLAEQGFNLILVARREAPLEKLASALRDAHPIQCITASIDLSGDQAVETMRKVAAGREVGLLILNAGADPNSSMFLENNVANWEELVMRNVLTMMRACHRFAQPMRKRGHGGIMIVGSAACYAGAPGIAVYGATKAFDLVFSEALWAELKPQGVDVLSYVIGSTDTPAHRQLMEQRGMRLPADMADADDVARLGLEHLSKGPVKNFGLADDEAGHAGLSAAERRERTLAFAKQSIAYDAKA
ncbi:MAG: SDR family NAD(P)-dependent oxidoreductase [Sphingomonadaceae bacterium]|nr:SDR family NAD(P)-dependent oxidoreductase [Sphingomonadaceae bacterium]